MLSKKLMSLFGGIASLILFVTAVILDREYSWVSLFMIPFVVGLLMSYVFAPQLDWWSFKRNPPDLPSFLGNLLLTHLPFYQNLTAANKTRFRQRVAMYLEARGFFAQRGEEEGEVPLDMKTMVAANVVMLTFGRKDFILKKFERIFIYLQAFPTPNYQYLHASEINREDECLIFSAEHLTLSFRQPNKYYNIMVHEYAKAFQLTYPNFDYPTLDESIWNNKGKKQVAKYMGIPEDEINQLGVSVNFFFENPEKFKELMPKGFEKYQTIFNLNPLQKNDPVVDKSVVEGVP
jgi:Mlc titration factor MtfA (ptsG expression regulator)